MSDLLCMKEAVSSQSRGAVGFILGVGVGGTENRIRPNKKKTSYDSLKKQQNEGRRESSTPSTCDESTLLVASV